MACRCCSYGGPYYPCYHQCCKPRKYGFWDFALDCLLIFLSAGLWIIWMVIRTIIRNSRSCC